MCSYKALIYPASLGNLGLDSSVFGKGLNIRDQIILRKITDAR